MNSSYNSTVQRTKAFLVLLDISGYTQFVRSHGRNIEHAEAVVTSLLGAVVRKASIPLVLHEVAGDSVAFYAESDGDPGVSRLVWAQTELFFETFRSAERTSFCDGGTSTCPVCAQRSPLKLKAVLHHAEVVITSVGGFTKVAGPDVILAHKLLKNTVLDDEYMLLTTSFLDAMEDLPLQGGIWQMEDCGEFGEIPVLVMYPHCVVPKVLQLLRDKEEPARVGASHKRTTSTTPSRPRRVRRSVAA